MTSSDERIPYIFPHLQLVLQYFFFHTVTNHCNKRFSGIDHGGFGKTLAYIVPLIVHIQMLSTIHRYIRCIALICASKNQKVDHIFVLLFNILKAAQSNIKCRVLLSTTSISDESEIEIIIGTPRNLNAHVDRNHSIAHRCTFLVIDGVDQQLGNGNAFD